MTVEELFEEKSKLEQELAKILRDFQERTKVAPLTVQITTTDLTHLSDVRPQLMVSRVDVSLDI